MGWADLSKRSNDMSMRLSEHAIISDADNLTGSDGQPFLQDIGGTNAQSDYVSMKDFARCMAYYVLGTWNATDDVDECRIQQASAAAGTGVKDLTTDAAAGDYDTDNPIDADGDFVIIEVRAEDLDVDSATPFNHVRAYAAEGGNSGVDNVGFMLVRYGYAYPQKELQGAAATGSKVYVDTSTGT